MNEQEKFQAWWELHGTNSVILRAQAWSAWLARAEAEQPVGGVTMQPTADPDEWVIQDQVPIRDGIDEGRYQLKGTAPSYGDRWFKLSAMNTHTRGLMHGSQHKHDPNCTLHVRCRRRDLPKVEQPTTSGYKKACEIVAKLPPEERNTLLLSGMSHNPTPRECQPLKPVADHRILGGPHDVCVMQSSEQAEQWPKYYTGIVSGTAYVKRLSPRECVVVETDGTETAPMRWADWDERKRTEITEAEAMALLKKPKQCAVGCHGPRCHNPALPGKDHCSECGEEPQPQKTRVRLWMRNEPKGRPSVFACDERPYPDSHKYIEIHYDHETRQFYTEEPS